MMGDCMHEIITLLDPHQLLPRCDPPHALPLCLSPRHRWWQILLTEKNPDLKSRLNPSIQTRFLLRSVIMWANKIRFWRGSLSRAYRCPSRSVAVDNTSGVVPWRKSRARVHETYAWLMDAKITKWPFKIEATHSYTTRHAKWPNGECYSWEGFNYTTPSPVSGVAVNWGVLYVIVEIDRKFINRRMWMWILSSGISDNLEENVCKS